MIPVTSPFSRDSLVSSFHRLSGGHLHAPAHAQRRAVFVFNYFVIVYPEVTNTRRVPLQYRVSTAHKGLDRASVLLQVDQ